jgi:hypothetical protein
MTRRCAKCACAILPLRLPTPALEADGVVAACLACPRAVVRSPRPAVHVTCPDRHPCHVCLLQGHIPGGGCAGFFQGGRCTDPVGGAVYCRLHVVLRAVQALVGQAREAGRAGGGMARRLVLITFSRYSIVPANVSVFVAIILLAGGRRRPSNIAQFVRLPTNDNTILINMCSRPSHCRQTHNVIPRRNCRGRVLYYSCICSPPT